MFSCLQAISVVCNTGQKIYIFYNKEKEQVCACVCVVCVSTHAHTCTNTDILLIIVNKRDIRKNKESQKNPTRVGKDQRIHSNLFPSSKTSLIKAFFLIIIICLLW